MIEFDFKRLKSGWSYWYVIASFLIGILLGLTMNMSFYEAKVQTQCNQFIIDNYLVINKTRLPFYENRSFPIFDDPLYPSPESAIDVLDNSSTRT